MQDLTLMVTLDQDKALRKTIWILLLYMKINQLQARLQGKERQNNQAITIDQVETNADYIQFFMKNYGVM